MVIFEASAPLPLLFRMDSQLGDEMPIVMWMLSLVISA